MPPLIDSHAHLCDPVFGEDRQQVLERARLAGVTAIVAVGEDLDDARMNLELTSAFPGLVFPAAGLFPTIIDLEKAAELERFIRSHAKTLVAIGEVGLDRWKVREEKELDLQHRIFSSFIDLAKEVDLPLNVHSRSAGRHAIELLLDRDASRVQLHAFDGKAASALPGVEAGFFFSIPPSVVRSAQKQKLVRRLPLDCMLLETDSPVLGPDAGVRNEPANLEVSLAAIAEIKGLSVPEVAERVLENTRRLYGDRIAGADGG